MRFWLDHGAEHLANRVATDQCFAEPVPETGVRFVQRHNRIEITDVEVLLEQARPIFGFDRQQRRLFFFASGVGAANGAGFVARNAL